MGINRRLCLVVVASLLAVSVSALAGDYMDGFEEGRLAADIDHSGLARFTGGFFLGVFYVGDALLAPSPDPRRPRERLRSWTRPINQEASRTCRVVSGAHSGPEEESAGSPEARPPESRQVQSGLRDDGETSINQIGCPSDGLLQGVPVRNTNAPHGLYSANTQHASSVRFTHSTDFAG